MPTPTRARLGLFLTVMAWAVVVAPANAYIDPASGTVVFQALIAGLAAAGTGIAMFWSRVVGFFQRSSGGGDATATSPAATGTADATTPVEPAGDKA